MSDSILSTKKEERECILLNRIKFKSCQWISSSTNLLGQPWVGIPDTNLLGQPWVSIPDTNLLGQPWVSIPDTNLLGQTWVSIPDTQLSGPIGAKLGHPSSETRAHIVTFIRFKSKGGGGGGI